MHNRTDIRTARDRTDENCQSWKYRRLQQQSVIVTKRLHLQLLITVILQALLTGVRYSLTTLKSVNNKSSAVAEMGDRGHNRHGPKRRGCCTHFAGEAGSPSNTMWPGPRSTSVPSGVFIHPAVWPPDMGRKLGAVPFLGRGELRPHLTSSPYQVASWSIQPFGYNRHGPKIGWGLCLFLEGSWVPI